MSTVAATTADVHVSKRSATISWRLLNVGTVLIVFWGFCVFCWLVVGRLVKFSWLVGCLVCCLAGWLVCLVGLLGWFAWLLGIWYLAGRLIGWLVGWLVGLAE